MGRESGVLFFAVGLFIEPKARDWSKRLMNPMSNHPIIHSTLPISRPARGNYQYTVDPGSLSRGAAKYNP